MPSPPSASASPAMICDSSSRAPASVTPNQSRMHCRATARISGGKAPYRSPALLAAMDSVTGTFSFMLASARSAEARTNRPVRPVSRRRGLGAHIGLGGVLGTVRLAGQRLVAAELEVLVARVALGPGAG